MIIAIPKEITLGEKRVAATPDSVRRLIKKGFEIQIEAGAGAGADFPDTAYESVGAKIIADAETLYGGGDLVLKVMCPIQNDTVGKHEIDMMKSGTTLVALLQPLTAFESNARLAERQINAFAVELIPRITRAQQMDVLSSMSSLAGYKAVLLAGTAYGKTIPMMTTAAGTLYPAKVLVLGAGVAGLQAIATAKRLGAMVEAFDTRPAVKEQVESLGATFVALELAEDEGEGTGGYAKALSEESHQKELALIHERAKGADIIITTALIPGRKAPILITTEMLTDMKDGSVVIDMAVEQGGNCEHACLGEEVVHEGVKIIGAVNLASTIPVDASQLYGNNMIHFLNHLCPEKVVKIDLNDEITKGALVTHEGKVVNETVIAISGKSQAGEG